MMSVDQNAMPKWDVALEALVGDEFRRKGHALTLDDMHALAGRHAIRFDDIMETLFLLVINGEWRYYDRNGQPRILDQATLDRLYVNRRLTEQDIADFDGTWLPA